MFGNKTSQQTPGSQFVNIDPNASGNNSYSAHSEQSNPYPLQPPTPTNLFSPEKEAGKVKDISIVILVIFLIIFGGLFIWKYSEWAKLDSDFEQTIAETLAKREEEIEDKYATEYEKKKEDPYLEFSGPEDYGDLHFKYPNTWSVYTISDASDGKSDFKALMHPYGIGPNPDQQILALRVQIVNQSFESIISEYNKAVEAGTYTHTTDPINAGSSVADIFEGNFQNGMKIKVAIFKIRNQTVVLRTDSVDKFNTQFSNILSSITFAK